MSNLTTRGRGSESRTGSRLPTDQQIEALAREAETGYDLRQARRERVGRPSLESGVSPRVSFRTSQSLYEAARARAASQGRSISALAREAMEQLLAG
ncbi:MAG: CopG family transcriptional regulator [Chloroflexi bacterium]|nr:CopG family transcriptional regulator [Chloroflexota bacterium]